MIRKVETFDQGDRFCVVDTRSGRREVTYVKKGPDGKPESVPIARKAVNFARASADHARRGRPKASDEVVEARWQICVACPLFRQVSVDQGECTHLGCGCALRPVRARGISKLRWANEACPIGNWGAVDVVR